MTPSDASGRSVPLRLTATGPGSRREILDYVRSVIESQQANPENPPERVARNLVTSILARLGADYRVAVGEMEPGDEPGPEPQI